MPDKYCSLLRRLALLYRIQTSYFGADHRRQNASNESLFTILQGLGASLNSYHDIPDALREYEAELSLQTIESVIVAWDGILQSVTIRKIKDAYNFPVTVRLIHENGEEQTWCWDNAELEVVPQLLGKDSIMQQLPLSTILPYGYHKLILELPNKSCETLVISAPRCVYHPEEKIDNRSWGVFLPLYALRTDKDWGSGDLSSLDTLQQWVCNLRGNLVATLPLLSAFLDKPFESSPYAPVSRLFWNEFYLDVNNIPELSTCPAAREVISSPEFLKKLEYLRSLDLVDYRGVMAVKKQVLLTLSRYFFTSPSKRLADFNNYVANNSTVKDYAKFRAVMEKQQMSWKTWPRRLSEGVIQERDFDLESQNYHLYIQWLLSQHISELSRKARHHSPGMYLDFPVGVHPDGYDAWRWQNIFLNDFSIGAPPDAVFTSGQKWNSPPLHPEIMRHNKYDYFISCIRHHIEHAGILRIDHMMSFHRLYWIAKGMTPSQGVYVRYHPDEMYAILSLESHRYKTMVVGEDLGIVPPDVRIAISQHGIHHMYVAQYEFIADSKHPVHPVPVNSVASLNTHDMPPFASFWKGSDIQYRHDWGLINKIVMQDELEQRRKLRDNLNKYLQTKGSDTISKANVNQIINTLLLRLSASPAKILLVNLEDLWGETEPQNIPGTTKYPNWQKKARYSFEEFSNMPQIQELLRLINQNRKSKRNKKRR